MPVVVEPITAAPPAPTARRAASALPASAAPVRRKSVVRRLLRHLAPTTWAYLDLILISVITWTAHAVLALRDGVHALLPGPVACGLTFSTCFVFAGLVFGWYENRTLLVRSRIIVRAVLTLGLGLVLAFACAFLLLGSTSARWLGPVVALAYGAGAVPLRLCAHEVITAAPRRVLCIGSGESVRKLVSLLAQSSRTHIEVVGYLHASPPTAHRLSGALAVAHLAARRAQQAGPPCPRLGDLGDIDAVLRAHAIDEVVVGSEVTNNAAVGQAVLTCLDRRCRVTDQSTFVEKLLGEVPAEDIDAQWFLVADVQSRGMYETAKRMLDVVTALIGLVLSLPLWVLIAAVIRLDGRGPIFFRQRRVGRHGREFTICKFRTMRPDAEKDGARWASANDPRITRCGRLLRLSRLDELPQLWNILRGDMSLVGPRPERPEFVAKLARAIPHYRQRHLVKPGLTGWAQIHFGYGATVDDARRKLCFDLYYLKHRSLELDFAVVIRTIGTFVLGAR